MGYVVRTPTAGAGTGDRTVAAWYVSDGDSVSQGQVLAEVETQKGIHEVRAKESGTVHKQYVSEGQVAHPGEPMAIIAETSSDIRSLEAAIEASTKRTKHA